MTNKKFGIIVMDLSLFDFGPKPPCGYIKAKHIRPAYGKGTITARKQWVNAWMPSVQSLSATSPMT